MRKENCIHPSVVASGVTVDVNVAKIVKYVSIASVLIVAIIFISGCLNNWIKK